MIAAVTRLSGACTLVCESGVIISIHLEIAFSSTCRYINMLEKDLIDYPDDPRTLYYLGYAHYDVFIRNKGALQS